MIKATSGGGGKGMRIVRESSELEDAFHREIRSRKVIW